MAAFTQTLGQATAKLVTAQIFGQFKDATTTGWERPAHTADVSDDAERALQERIQPRQVAQAQPVPGRAVAATAGRGSVFQWLGEWPGSPAEGNRFQVRPEMTPRKIERGRQPGQGSGTSEKMASHSQSGQKRRSASRGCNEVDAKKGKTDGGLAGATGCKEKRVSVGID